MHLDANGATVGFHAMENKAHKTELTGGTFEFTGRACSQSQANQTQEGV